ncbi:unnamed protein product [Danaus chrysippus]|uniref:(African queen) hypothetical protein n=1 Tax=Danaus chrysippus TaxID=151541 RepID=A0A8J2RAQ7_9NEOP|nr:unnamed protein product [Danaus chrysippus]
MALKSFLLVLVLSFLVTASASSIEDLESREKKKKIALFIYFADLVLKKIFIFKIIYAFIFWLVIHKAGYFLSWFVSYLKDQKHHHHDYHDHMTTMTTTSLIMTVTMARIGNRAMEYNKLLILNTITRLTTEHCYRPVRIIQLGSRISVLT